MSVDQTFKPFSSPRKASILIPRRDTTLEYAESTGVSVKLMPPGHETCLVDSLFQNVGIPSILIPDNAMELTKGEFKRKATRASCPIHPIEPRTSNANLCEDGMRETLRGFR